MAITEHTVKTGSHTTFYLAADPGMVDWDRATLSN